MKITEKIDFSYTIFQKLLKWCYIVVPDAKNVLYSKFHDFLNTIKYIFIILKYEHYLPEFRWKIMTNKFHILYM